MPMEKKFIWKRIAALIAVFAVTVCCAFFGTLFYAQDMWLFDTLCQKPSVANKNIYVIAIDDKTLAEYGAITSWSRSLSADLVKILNTGENRPAVIGFDVIYSEAGEEAGDAEFAEVCREAGNVVTAMSFQFKEMPETDETGSVTYNPYYVDHVTTPYGGLYASAASGYANTIVDADGYVRRVLPFITYQNETAYSFAAQVYKTYQESRGGEVVFPKQDENGLFYFSYSGSSGCYSTVSMADVLDKTVDPKIFSDAIVFVGAYAVGMQDAYTPAISRNRQMYGVEIQANIVEALLESRTQVDIPRWLYALFAGLFVALYFYLVRKVRIIPATIALFAFAAADLAAAKLLHRGGYVMPAFLPLLAVVLVYAGNLIAGYIAEVRRRRRVVEAFKMYVAPQVVDKISKKKNFEIVLGGENRHIAVLFVDIRGFTTMSESLPPEEVVEILNQYLSLTTDSIFRNGGTLDKFIGDATMAVFNAPFDLEDYVYRAVCTARDMRAGADRIASLCMERYGKSVSFGIGIHCGDAVVGNIGCEFRMDYTAIGDTVNTAARLESNAGRGQILISRDVYETLKDRIAVTPVGEIPLKGKEVGVYVYQFDDVI